MKLFSDEFFYKVKNDPINGAKELCKIILSNINKLNLTDADYENLIEGYTFLIELEEARLIELNFPKITIIGNKHSDTTNLIAAIHHIENIIKEESVKLRLKHLKLHFKTSLSSVFHYEFTQGDLDRIQTLLNELRSAIADAPNLENDHRQRVLKRLENLQSELHKKVSDLDRFWGLIGDAGVVAGKLGSDAKPIVDRIKELTEITWRTQSKAEELPSGTQPTLIEHKTD